MQNELEAKIIYAILSDPAAHEYIFSELLPEHFTGKEARSIYSIALAMHLRGQPADYATIQPKANGELFTYLMDITKKDYLSLGFEPAEYVRELKRLWTCRAAAAVARNAAEKLDQGEDAAIYELSAKLDTFETGASNRLIEIKDAVASALNSIGNIQKTIYKTGIKAIDKYCRGAAPGRMLVFGAGTGDGKSALALNVGLNVAENGGTVLYISLEMNAEEIALRLIASAGEIRLDRLQNAAEENDGETLQAAADIVSKLESLKFVLSCTSSTAQQIISMIKQVKAAYGSCDLVIVDYLQLVTLGRRTETREREIADISRALSAAALQEETCIIALSQVNRQVSLRETHELMLSDIRESSAPTHDASAVFFLYPANDEDEDLMKYELKIAKNRNGRTGITSLIFDKPKQKFYDVKKP